jgi:hypothetical protein
MTLTINIDPATCSRLEAEARRLGIEPSEYARRLIESGVRPEQDARSNAATLDLLAQWDREDETSDPAEIARREEELRELKRSLNENRTSGRTPFPC